MDTEVTDVLWVRIKSWHAVERMVPNGSWLTLCGRQAPGESETHDTLRAGRSCESCLRVLARLGDGGTPGEWGRATGAAYAKGMNGLVLARRVDA